MGLISAFFISFLILWLFFINVMTWKKHLASIPKWLQYPLRVIAWIGIIWDAFFNIIFGTLMYLQLPRQWMLTTRMKEILIKEDPESWRFKITYFICHYFVEPWDPNHCGLDNIEI